MDNSLLEAIHDTFSLESKDINLYAPLTLAYIGDAVFEIIIRTLIVEEKSGTVKKLHLRSSKLVNAKAQADLLTAIGIPSFVLALEHHEETIPKGFLRNVLRVSLPAAICMVGSLVAITLVGEWFSLSELILSTMHLIAGGIVSFGVLLAVCIPMSRVRFALCLTVIGIFVGAILLFPGFFGVAPIMHLIMTLL